MEAGTAWASVPENLQALTSVEVDGAKISACQEAGGEITKVDYLISDPVHCVVANHTHLSAGSICLSIVCSFIDDIPKGYHEGMFTHQNAPSEKEPKKGLYTEPPISKAGQLCRYLAMGSLMIMVKPLNEKEANYEYLRKRWSAALASLGISDQTNEKGAGPVCKEILKEFNEYIHAHPTIKNAYVKLTLMKMLKGTLPPDSVTRALVTQIKLIWEEYGMCTTKLMEGIVDQNTPLLSCAIVAEEAIALKKAIRRLKESMKELYPFTGVLGLMPESLYNSKFPNLLI